MRNARTGFVLPVAVIMLAIVGIVVAAVGGYVSTAARLTRVHLARSRCRFAAQSAVEQAKSEIQQGFSRYVGGSGAASIKIDPRQADVYNWFDVVSGDRRTIGIANAKYDAVTLASPVTVNGCTVYVGIGRSVDHASGSSCAIVPVVATAVFAYPDGLEVTATIQERVAFGTGQSPVFDYAYFVNNYGWMNGSSIVINGDMRANGNVSLSASTVNGFVYAAANDELGVDGSVTLSSSPQIKNIANYRSSCGNRARSDTDDYRTAGSYDAPKTSGTIRKPTFDRDGNVTGGTVGASSGKPIVNESSDSLPMPFVSELENYVSYAREYDNNRGGTLKCPAYSYTDGAGKSHSVAAATVNSHFNGVGPSGDPALADKGALVLVGTAAKPIEIDGPVVVDSDVVIKGYVKGQGTIYSGRNVHIIGDLKYVNPPNWAHPDGDDEAVEASNAQKDMLGLVAKGNIVVGDSSSSSWMNSVRSYIDSSSSSSVVNSYACDPSDANIGYPATFGGNYTAVETVSSLPAEKAASAPGGYRDGRFGKVRTKQETKNVTTSQPQYDRWGRLTGYKDVTTKVSETVLCTSNDRRYYETVCDDKILSSLKDSAGISQIDAILYNNHGIFGTPGRSGYNFNLNGSLVCRDEALIFSGNGIRFNWDMRLRCRNKNNVSNRLSLPVGPQEPCTVEWMQVPDALNAVYVAARGGVP